MKFTIALLMTTQATSVFSAAASTMAATCNSLSVMDVPADADPSSFRACKEHPLNRRPRLSESSVPPNSTGRAEALLSSSLREDGDNEKCFYSAPYGCDNNYCWKACGDEGSGSWCWLAQDGGTGAWDECRSWEDCDPGHIPGSDCGKGCVGSCGCSC
ncbi:hypothetical protein BJX99DRAFT_254727 [Aspergillus californicus]